MSTPKSSEKFRLAFSTNAYLKFSFAEAARRLAAIGYPGIEIMADVPHAWPACLLEEQKEAMRRALRENKLAISNINAFMMNAVSVTGTLPGSSRIAITGKFASITPAVV